MKAIAIVGSPRRNGNTEILASHTLEAIKEEGLDTELIKLAKSDIRPCTACDACQKEEMCSIDDDFWPIYTKMKEVDVILFATPVYFSSIFDPSFAYTLPFFNSINHVQKLANSIRSSLAK